MKRVHAAFGGGLACVLILGGGGEKEPQPMSAERQVMVPAVDREPREIIEPSTATITLTSPQLSSANQLVAEQVMVTAVESLPASLEIMPDITQGILGPAEVVISPVEEPDCAVQVHFEPSRANPNKGNVTFVTGGGADMFRGSNDNYTKRLYSNSGGHAESNDEDIAGYSFDPGAPAEIHAAWTAVANRGGLV